MCWFIVWYQVWTHIIRFYTLVTGPAHSCAISTPQRAYSPAAVSAHWTYRTHCHLCLSDQVLNFTWVKWSIWGWSALPKDTKSLRGEKILHQGERDSKLHCRQRHRLIGRAPRSNYCAMSLSIIGRLFCNLGSLCYLYLDIHHTSVKVYWN